MVEQKTITNKKKQECQWCQYNARGCGDYTNCDFRTLAYEEQAIIQRIQEETTHIKQAIEEILDGNATNEETAKTVLDKMAGIRIMSERLKQDFKKTDEEIEKLCGNKKLVSQWNKIRLLKRLATLKKQRGTTIKKNIPNKLRMKLKDKEEK